MPLGIEAVTGRGKAAEATAVVFATPVKGRAARGNGGALDTPPLRSAENEGEKGARRSGQGEGEEGAPSAGIKTEVNYSSISGTADANCAAAYAANLRAIAVRIATETAADFTAISLQSPTNFQGFRGSEETGNFLALGSLQGNVTDVTYAPAPLAMAFAATASLAAPYG